MTEHELVNQIKIHRDKYWVDNDPEITDAEYDLLIEQLKLINPKHPVLTSIEYNAFINGDKKIQHPTPMLSLEKVFSFESIKAWMKKIARNTTEEFTISPKYDGISARYYIKQNILASRGNGEYGEDLSNKFPLLEIESDSNNTNISGEILIKNDRFEACNLKRKDGRSYATPRNLAAGIMNLKDITNLIGKIKLTFIDHKKITTDVKYNEFNEDFWNLVLSKIEDIKKIYPLDGIVIELKDTAYSNSLGLTAHHPKGKVAFKFENNFAYSTLQEVTFQIGKHKLTPVAHIKPISLGGVTIKKVTLHNAKMLIDNDIHIGDQLKIIRSGDVIPYVVGIEQGLNRKPIIIESCPYCFSPLEYREPELYCSSKICVGTSSKQLYESVRSLGIDGIGQTTIDKFIEHLGVSTILDILTLEQEEIENLPDFGEVSASNIIESIDKVVNSVEDYKVLASLNIRNIGVRLSKQILSEYTLPELLNISIYELNNIPGLGDIRSDDIIRELSNSQELLTDLMELLNIVTTKGTETVSVGNICFSGTFPKRKEIYQDMARKAGYNIVEDVTKSLTYLVAAGPATSKVSKARNYGIPVLRLETFLELISK
jgi:DNA ligase (NAD+)